MFKIADDQGLLLLDLKDLRAMVRHVGDNAWQFTTDYGNVSTASVGAIQRALLTLESQGADKFFGEPALDLDDLMQTDGGQGVVNILAADRLMSAPIRNSRSRRPSPSSKWARHWCRCWTRKAARCRSSAHSSSRLPAGWGR
jgi:DNA helicase HerA-like ATPase